MKIELQGVHKYFDARSGPIKILENVSLVIPTGDFVSIMGPSGSGKTTLLNIIGCLEHPSYGKVFLDSIDVSGASENDLEQVRLNRIGFVFQSYNLLPTLTVLENVQLPMQLSGRVKERNEQINQAMTFLRLVGLDARAKDPVTRLSGGQQQRVAIARALANLPKLILADEPTGNLDERSSKEVMDVFKVINEHQRITTVMVTHDSKAANYGKRVLYLEGGHLVERSSSR